MTEANKWLYMLLSWMGFQLLLLAMEIQREGRSWWWFIAGLAMVIAFFLVITREGRK